MKIKTKNCVVLGILVLTIFACVACGKKDDKPKKIQDLEFTVVSEECLPEELKEEITQKKENEFKITYTDGNYLYIGIGYGTQKTGGYSIAVNELYLTQNAIYVNTNLIGPEPGEQKKDAKSFPYIVLKLESMDKTVVFE